MNTEFHQAPGLASWPFFNFDSSLTGSRERKNLSWYGQLAHGRACELTMNINTSSTAWDISNHMSER